MIDNKAMFAKTLNDYPPEFNFGDKVKTEMGVGYITGRTFNEREKVWKYVYRPIGLNTHFDVKKVVRFI
jgi:hypothetical protein